MRVHLRSYHRKVKKFKHPLLDGVKPITEERAAELVEQYLDLPNKANQALLIVGLLSALRHLIGRYIGNWPATRPYLDDMIGEGLLSIVKTVNTLKSGTLADRSILHVATMRATKAIETMLYELGSVATPARRTYEYASAAGQELPYNVIEGNLDDVMIGDDTTKQEQDLIDAEEAISVMAARLQLDADLLKAEYRNLTAEEAAARLGVHHTTVSRRRAKLRSRYHIEFGG